MWLKEAFWNRQDLFSPFVLKKITEPYSNHMALVSEFSYQNKTYKAVITVPVPCEQTQSICIRLDINLLHLKHNATSFTKLQFAQDPYVLSRGRQLQERVIEFVKELLYTHPHYRLKVVTGELHVMRERTEGE